MTSQDCPSVIGGWAVGLTGECLPPEAGISIGNKGYKHVYLQVSDRGMLAYRGRDIYGKQGIQTRVSPGELWPGNACHPRQGYLLETKDTNTCISRWVTGECLPPEAGIYMGNKGYKHVYLQVSCDQGMLATRGRDIYWKPRIQTRVSPGEWPGNACHPRQGYIWETRDTNTCISRWVVTRECLPLEAGISIGNKWYKHVYLQVSDWGMLATEAGISIGNKGYKHVYLQVSCEWPGNVCHPRQGYLLATKDTNMYISRWVTGEGLPPEAGIFIGNQGYKHVYLQVSDRGMFATRGRDIYGKQRIQTRVSPGEWPGMMATRGRDIYWKKGYKHVYLQVSDRGMLATRGRYIYWKPRIQTRVSPGELWVNLNYYWIYVMRQEISRMSG